MRSLEVSSCLHPLCDYMNEVKNENKVIITKSNKKKKETNKQTKRRQKIKEQNKKGKKSKAINQNSFPSFSLFHFFCVCLLSVVFSACVFVCVCLFDWLASLMIGRLFDGLIRLLTSD